MTWRILSTKPLPKQVTWRTIGIKPLPKPVMTYCRLARDLPVKTMQWSAWCGWGFSTNEAVEVSSFTREAWLTLAFPCGKEKWVSAFTCGTSRSKFDRVPPTTPTLWVNGTLKFLLGNIDEYVCKLSVILALPMPSGDSSARADGSFWTGERQRAVLVASIEFSYSD